MQDLKAVAAREKKIICVRTPQGWKYFLGQASLPLAAAPIG